MTEEFAPVIYVTIYSTPKPLLKARSKHQPWRWKATSEGNNRTLASGEGFYNREDCLDSVMLLFASTSTVFVRAAETGNRLIRRASDLPPF